MRTIGVVTTSRADFGIFIPILKMVLEDTELNLNLLVTGMHLSPEFGRTYEDIENQGFKITEKIEMLISGDTPEALAKSIGLGAIGFGQAFSSLNLDILLVLGDRFEMLSAVIAALPFTIPVAHLHGGESTEGAIDESIRHAITKMSHLHFTSTEMYRNRVIQMGEEPWRVHVSGAPSLDNLTDAILMDENQIEERTGLKIHEEQILVTFHPATLEFEDTERQVDELVSALDKSGLPVIFTYPNADTYSRIIINKIRGLTQKRGNCQITKNLGTHAYFSLMSHAAAMVGNSSSGIVEAASFSLPVVNIGNRQRGRLHGKNVIDVGYESEEILRGINRALSNEFRKSIAGIENPYGDGKASAKIVEQLKSVELGNELICKRFIQKD